MLLGDISGEGGITGTSRHEDAWSGFVISPPRFHHCGLLAGSVEGSSEGGVEGQGPP